MSWTNDDGLLVKFGVEESVKGKVSESRNEGQSRVTEIRYSSENMPAVADNSVVIDYGYVLPKGAMIESVEIVPYEDVASTSSDITLNVGIVDADGGTTILDVDALIVAATQTEINAGGVSASGWVGTRIYGTPLEEAAYLTWEVDNHAATDGRGMIRILWSVPQPDGDTLVWSK